MKSAFTALLIALIGAAFARAETISVSRTFATGGADEVSVHFPVGDLRIEAGQGSEVLATLTAHCRYGGRGCARRAERLRVVSSRRGRSLHLKLEGYPRFDLGGLQVMLRLRIPPTLPVEVHQGVGDLEVHGLDRDVEVHMGVGDVEIRLPQEAVGSVRANVGIGDASLHHAGRRVGATGFISQKLRWNQGSGPGQVEVHLGIGAVDVALR